MDNKKANKIIEELLNQDYNKLTPRGKTLFQAIKILKEEKDTYQKQCKHYEELREYYKSTKDCYEEFEL